VIIIASGRRRHVAGGVRRHVAAAFVYGDSTARAAVVRVVVICHRRSCFPHASDRRVSTAGAGHRIDAHQNIGICYISSARVTGTETAKSSKRKSH